MRRANGLALFAVGVALEVVLRPLHRAGSVQHQRLAADRKSHLKQRRVIFVGIVVQAVKVGLDIVRFGIGIVQQGGVIKFMP